MKEQGREIGSYETKAGERTDDIRWKSFIGVERI